MKRATLLFVLLSVSIPAVAASQWTQLRSLCFEGTSHIDGQKQAMAACQNFVNNLNKTATDNFVVQASCRQGSVDVCGYGYNQKAQVDIKVLVIEDQKTCN